jgi:homogentisate 1,2-dioxygenase
MESCFLPTNPNVQFEPSQMAWDPFTIPSDTESVDFIDGLTTMGGQGDSTLKEGLAIHIYAANASMGSRAFCSNDGNLLILPQLGRLDIQTEFGRLGFHPLECRLKLTIL